MSSASLVNPAVSAPSTVAQVLPDLASPEGLASIYGGFAGVAPTDVVMRVATSNGQSIVALVLNPLFEGTESIIEINSPAVAPCSLEIEASMSQRPRHAWAAIELSDGLAATPPAVGISSIYQCSVGDGAAYNATAGALLTAVLSAPLPGGLYLGDWVSISGLLDNRVNYPNCVIRWISLDRRTVCIGFSDETALPSIAVSYAPAAGAAWITPVAVMRGSDGVGIRFSGAAPTSAVHMSRFGGLDVQVTGVLTGDQRTTISTTTPVYLSAAMGQAEIKTQSRYRIDVSPREVSISDKAVDAQVIYSARTTRTGVKPDMGARLRPRLRGVNPLSMTRPVAQIISASKAGSAVTTIVHDGQYPFVTGQWVTIKGIRDSANFSASTTPAQVAVLTPKSFTVSFGGSATATSYGGFVCLANGNVDQPGVLAPAVQNATANADGSLTVGGSSGWSGINVGDVVMLFGARDAAGLPVGYDGMWLVANLLTTTLILWPLFSISGSRVSPTVAPAGAVQCGGAIIACTIMRSHDIVFESWRETRVMVRGQGTQRVEDALPITSNIALPVSQSTGVTISATDGSGAWPVRPGIVGIADLASGALTATATSPSTLNDKGTSFQVCIPVTAVSGTSPTLDIRIEESHDGGTNWVALYDFQRITAVGYYYSPMLRATGRNIRYVQTLGGTTPSFTRSITRNLWPATSAEPQRRIYDRAVSLTTGAAATALLFAGEANNAQLVVNLGAATTPPVLKLQGSEDAGVTWYDLPGGTLATIANGTAQVTVKDVNATWLRAIVDTAGAGVTPGYVLIKAWS